MKKDIKDWAIKQTNDIEWSKSKFKKFLLNAMQEEFLKSQIPFFYAVQSFPRMLCKLAMSIEDSEDRLLVVENIHEEHGEGQSSGFHTQTYKTYLQSLGWEGDYFKNPWVSDWIDNILNSNFTASQLAAYLSGIEYLYALISYDITEHLKTLDLQCEQSHYANHAVLDWEHGYELLSVAINLEKDHQINEDLKNHFNQGQIDFLYMYSNLRIPTQSQMAEINKEKIAFYYIREDSAIEKEVLQDLDGESLSILSIASGGEHIFEYLTLEKPSVIDIIDININQLELSQKKLDSLLTGIDNTLFDKNEIGKFELLFSVLRSHLSEKEIDALLVGCVKAHEKLKFIVTILFSNEYLNIVFGEDATKYTKKNFADHFYNTFTECLKLREPNSLNIFKKEHVRNYQDLSFKIKKNYEKHQLNWEVTNPKFFASTKSYDMINLSNIGDWMSLSDYTNMIKILKNNTSSGGCIIARKLLGDYSLQDIFEENGFTCVIKEDKTKFYSEVVVGYKK